MRSSNAVAASMKKDFPASSRPETCAFIQKQKCVRSMCYSESWLKYLLKISMSNAYLLAALCGGSRTSTVVDQ